MNHLAVSNADTGRRIRSYHQSRSTIERLEQRQLLSAAVYQPTPNGVPGTIEAENYNLGGQNVAYHTPLTYNPGGALRKDAVGIGSTSDTGGGYYLGWTFAGTWFQYTATVASTTTYTLQIREASANRGTCQIFSDGKAVTGLVSLPSTGGWQNWTTVTVPNVNLTAGTHLIRLAFPSAVNPRSSIANINWFSFADNPSTSPRTAWWRNAKYGMFIHWGLYSKLAGHWNGQTTSGYGEWIMHDLHIPIASYAQVASSFDPVQFSAQAIVNAAKSAGMQYIVITSKHHDGFSMYNSHVSSYNVVAGTPWHTDPIAALSSAATAAGLHFGLYYSIMDWHHPELATSTTSAGAHSPTDPAVVAYIHNQLEPQIGELITQYHPSVLWFDGEWVPWWNEEYGRELTEYAHSLEPGIIINNRVGKRTSTDGDYDTPEQLIPTNEPAGRLWETAMTLNNTWGYKDTDHNWKPPATILNDLIDVVASGGNYLLNVGPDGNGVIPSASTAILSQVGQWISANRGAIYNTTTAPVTTEPWGHFTRDGNALYAIVNTFPTNGSLHLDIKGAVRGAHFLVGGAAVGFASASTGITLTVPRLSPATPTVIEVDFSGPMSGL